MSLILVPYANLVIAVLTISIGILFEPHFVSKLSVWINAAFLLVTWLTTPLSWEFTMLLIAYLVIAYVVLHHEKDQDDLDSGFGSKKQRRLISFLFLGFRGYGSMLLSLAFLELGMLSWVEKMPVLSYLATLGSLGTVFGGWIVILVAVHLVGTMIKGRP
jgi:hypothetical protein